MSTTPTKPHADRCRDESTRDVIFLFQECQSKKRDLWRTTAVFLTREEGEAFGRATAYRYPRGWRVWGTVAEGKLAELLRGT